MRKSRSNNLIVWRISFIVVRYCEQNELVMTTQDLLNDVLIVWGYFIFEGNIKRQNEITVLFFSSFL